MPACRLPRWRYACSNNQCGETDAHAALSGPCHSATPTLPTASAAPTCHPQPFALPLPWVVMMVSGGGDGQVVLVVVVW